MIRTRPVRLAALFPLLRALHACGGNGPAPSASPLLQVGGTYQIVKTTTENTCDGNLTPSTVTGAVTHVAGATTLTLNDSFTSFNGSIETDGRFTMPSLATAPHLGAPVTTTFEAGRFSAGGFEAQVRLDINGPLGTPPFAVCRVTQSWRGTKQGAPNVIPTL
jgi:hypothetical protein